ASHGIILEDTPSYSPETLGVAERFNRTVMEMVRALLNASGLGKEFWAEAAATSTYLKKGLPHSALKDQTPYEALTGNKPSIQHLQPFGCECYIHIPKEKRKPGSKLSPRAHKGIFLGYTDTTRHYRIFKTEERCTMTTGDVFFPPLPAEGAPTPSGPTPTTFKDLVQHVSLNLTPSSSPIIPSIKELSDDTLWMEWMERNLHQAHALFEQGNPYVVRLLSNLVLAGKRSGIGGPPYVNWNEETTPKGAQTPAGWLEGHNKSSSSPQPEDPKTSRKSPLSPPAINLGESSSLSSSESSSDPELPSQTLEPPPLQHQTA